MTDLEQQLTDHLQARAAAVTVRYDLEAVEQGIGSVEFVRADDRPTRRPLIGALVAAAAAALVGVAVVGALTQDDPSTIVTQDDASTSVTTHPVGPATTVVVAEESLAAFLGGWTSTDTDGSAQTMEIGTTDDGSAQMTIRDTAATSACSGVAATVTGTAELDSRGDLVMVVSGLTCEDGSEPTVPAEELGDRKFTHDPQSDTLTDALGVVWRREGADDPSPAPPTSDTMWPQSSVDEVREAQELADAGDPASTWQIDPQLSTQEWWGYLREPGAEIVERFLREALGWDGFLFNPYAANGAADGAIRGLEYLRCAPGQTNPLYPIAPDGHQEAPGAERCAPTIDDLHYETVSLDLAQLDRRGPDGIWVVSRWATAAPFTQADPNIAEAEATALLEEFLGARMAGEGAEGYVEVAGHDFLALDEVPLLYATTAGAPYERYEIERVSGPSWPSGEMVFTVRLFANGGRTVVEQPIASRDVGGARPTLVHGANETTENGRPVDVPYEFFDGDVTISAADPWELSPFFAVALVPDGQQENGRIELTDDPLPVAEGCEQGPAPADANALAASIQSDPDLDATAPVPVSVGGARGLAMDVTLAPAASVCDDLGAAQVLTHDGGGRGMGFDQGSRMRLYLVDLPEGSTTRILAIAIVAPEARFEDVMAAAAPVIESVEFHTEGP